MDECTEVIVRAQTPYPDAVGKELDFFEIPGDDYGTNDSLMISPSVFTELFASALKRIVDCVKDFDPGLPVAFHSLFKQCPCGFLRYPVHIHGNSLKHIK